MPELKYLEGRVAGIAYEIMLDACRARLGYELVKLIESPETKTALRFSSRGDAGIGIDSDLSKTFFIPKDAGNYHQWSLFGLHDRLNHGIEDELLQRVVYLMSEEANQTLRELEVKRKNDMARGRWFDTKTLHIEGQIYANARIDVLTDGKVQAKMQALYSDQAWRDYARQFNAQLLTSAQNQFERDAETISAELDDILKGQRVVGTSQPVLDDLGELLRMYAREMEITN